MSSAEDQLVAQAGAFLTRPDGRVALRMVAAAQALLDARGEALPRARERACVEGCAACCHMPVSLTLPEALAIHEHVAATWSASEREALRVVLAEASAAARADEEAYFMARRPCPFLQQGDDAAARARGEGRCRVYAVRPLACRGHASFSREACLAAHAAPDDHALADAVPVDDALRHAKDELKTTLGIVLLQARVHAIDAELASLVLLLDTEPDAERAWLAGADLVHHLDTFALASGWDSLMALLDLVANERLD